MAATKRLHRQKETDHEDRKKIVVFLVSIAVFSGAMAAPAIAADWSRTDMGGKVTVAGKKISLKDVKDDGRFVTTEYRYQSGTRSAGLSNKAGYGRTTSVTQSSNITNAKICASNRFPLPMDCGSWKF